MVTAPFPQRDRTPNIRAARGLRDPLCQSYHIQMRPQEAPFLRHRVDSELKNILSVRILGSQGQD